MEPMSHLNRRRFVASTAAAGAALVGGLGRLTQAQAASAAAELTPGVPAGLSSYVTMATLPGKKPLIQLADRAPNYESPLEYLRTPITPNDEFFIRYHLSDIPEIDAKTYKIAVGGDGANRQAEISFDDLTKLPAIEVVAVNQCSGNRRGLSKPHVAGVEWGYGCPCRKLNPDIMMMQSAQDWSWKDAANSLDRARERRILVER
jgi:sulfite dehydrogenase